MTEKFTKTELAIISLVLSQQADNYEQEMALNIYRISSKAEKLMDETEGSSDSSANTTS